jgi:hypothetical protein
MRGSHAGREREGQCWGIGNIFNSMNIYRTVTAFIERTGDEIRGSPTID